MTKSHCHHIPSRVIFLPNCPAGFDQWSVLIESPLLARNWVWTPWNIVPNAMQLYVIFYFKITKNLKSSDSALLRLTWIHVSRKFLFFKVYFHFYVLIIDTRSKIQIKNHRMLNETLDHWLINIHWNLLIFVVLRWTRYSTLFQNSGHSCKYHTVSWKAVCFWFIWRINYAMILVTVIF